MAWRDNYGDKALIFASFLIEQKRVINLKSSFNEYVATVRSIDADYKAMIAWNGEGEIAGLCTCHKENGYCAHTAALCLEVEKENPDFFLSGSWGTMGRKYVKAPCPFQHKDGQYFDLKKIYESKYFYDENIFKEAAEEKKDPTLHFTYSIEQEEENGHCSSVIVFSLKRKKQKNKGEIEIQGKVCRDRIEYLYCYSQNEEYCTRSNVSWVTEQKIFPCICKAMAFLFLQELIEEENPGSLSGGNTLLFLRKYGKKKEVVKLRDLEDCSTIGHRLVDIIPYFTSLRCDEVAFRIVLSKSYVISDIPKFLKALKEGNRIPFGSSESFSALSDTLSPKAEKAVAFMYRMRGNEKAYDTKTFNLFRDSYDDFFSTFSDSVILGKTGQEFHLKDEELRLVLTSDVTDMGDGEKMLTSTLKTEKEYEVEGVNYVYRIEKNNNKIIRAKKDDIGEFREFFEGDFKYSCAMQWGPEDIEQYYRVFLPRVKRCGNIDGSVFLKEERDAEKYIFLLDWEDKRVTCLLKGVTNEDEYYITPESLKHNSKGVFVYKQLNEMFSVIGERKWMTEKANDEIYLALKYAEEILTPLGEVRVSEALRKRLKKRGKFKVQVAVDNNFLDLQILTPFESDDDVFDILSAYKAKKKYYVLKNGEFLFLNYEDIEDVDKILSSVTYDKKALKNNRLKLSLNRAIYLNTLFENNESIQYDKSFNTYVENFKEISESEREIPKNLKADLREYQKTGYRWLRTLFDYNYGGILSDEMGLGKTLEAIALILSLKEDNIRGTTLVVTPASLIYNWEREIKKFSPTLSVLVIGGTPEERNEDIERCNEYDVIVTSYNLLRQDIIKYDGKEFLLEIIDEAQFIKNYTTEASKCAKAISAKHKFALTGTPIENNLSELWSIFDYLMPGFLFSYNTFRDKFELPIALDNSSREKDKLRKMTAPFILQRKKKDVLLDLPDKIEEIFYSSMGTEQRALYDAEVFNLKESLNKQTNKDYDENKMVILAYLTRLRELCCDPSLLYDEYSGGAAKLDALLDLIDRAMEGGHKILLFSQFTSMLEIIEKSLRKKKIEYYEITGSTSKEKRIELVDSFNSGNVPLFLISLKAGGTGLNLTGADIVIHYDPWWNVAVENQATDRAHRIGQTKVVTVYKMIAKDTIEDKIIEIQEKKKALTEDILKAGEISLGKLTKEDLLEILS